MEAQGLLEDMCKGERHVQRRETCAKERDVSKEKEKQKKKTKGFPMSLETQVPKHRRKSNAKGGSQ